jgi:hemolysin III
MQETSVRETAASAPHPPLDSRSEWRVDAMIHVVGMAFGLAACVILAAVALPSAGPTVLVSIAVYGAGLLAMLGCSALYNISGHGPRKALWRRLDHATIFVMIAGTYTLFAAIAIGGAWGMGLLVFRLGPWPRPACY